MLAIHLQSMGRVTLNYLLVNAIQHAGGPDELHDLDQLSKGRGGDTVVYNFKDVFTFLLGLFMQIRGTFALVRFINFDLCLCPSKRCRMRVFILMF